MDGKEHQVGDFEVLERGEEESFEEKTKKMVERHWDPEYYRHDNIGLLRGDGQTRRRIEEAEAQGEKIIEVPVTITVKIPENDLLKNHSFRQAANLAAESNFEAELCQQLIDKHPDLVSKAKEAELKDRIARGETVIGYGAERLV